MAAAIGCAGLLPGMAAADGTLDPSFGGTGLLTYNLVEDYEEEGRAVTVDSQGRIIVAETGRYSSTGYRGTFVARFLPDGTLDTTFSAGDDLYPDGIKDVAEATDSIMYSIAIDSEGRIVLGGQVDSPPNSYDWMIARLNANGTYDTSFGGGDGRIRTDVSVGGYDELTSVAVDSSDRILATGSYQVPGGEPRGMVARFLPNGDPDTSFGGSGMVDPFGSPTESSGLSDITIDANQRLVLSGRAPGADRFTALRMTNVGGLDPTFGQGGITNVDFDPVFNESAGRVGIDGEGRILLTGTVYGALLTSRSNRLSAIENDLAVTRLLPDGSVDTSYGTGGKARKSFTGLLRFSDATLDRAGRVVSSGSVGFGMTARTAATPLTRGQLTRFRADGSIDLSFGSGGTVEVSRTDREINLESVTIDSDGKYVFTGSENDEEFNQLLILGRLNVAYPTNPPSARPKCGGVRATIVGNHRRNVLKGTRKRDVIVGLGGNDVIRGLKGNDLICGRAGNDRLIGGPGKDMLIGEKGRDKLLGGPGKDRLIGGKGRDRCLAGKGRGRITGCERRR